MARIAASVTVFVAVFVVAVFAAEGAARGAAYYGQDWDEQGCGCCCEHPDGYQQRRHVPQITVHVIQPPPTYIYDVTQTACYTEHSDCCGCPYVCGPTCIPQGEVLAPCNIGKRVVVADNGRKRKGC